MIKTIDELRKIEIAEVATLPQDLLRKNNKGEVLATELERLVGSKEKYTIDDMSPELKKVLRLE